MRILANLHRKRNCLVHRYQNWKIEYQLWALRPKMFAVVALLGFIALCMTAFDIGAEGAGMRDEVEIQRSIANAFDEAPGIWLKQIEAKKPNLSKYQYELQKAQCEFFAARAPSIAERIRDDAVWSVLKKSLTMVGKQTAQVAVGKLAGGAADVVGTKIGYKVTQAGAKLTEKGYSRVGRYLSSKGEALIWGTAESLGEKFANLGWEVAEAAARDESWKSPVMEKAMKAPEFAELFQLIQEATDRNPDKLMGAHLYYNIQIAGNAKDRPDDEYRKSVMITAQNLKKLTKEGGSPDSMWNNVEALAKWIANKVGRPLPDEPEPDEPKPTLTLDNFTAYGEFTGLEELGYEIGHWKYNTITFTVKDGKFKGEGWLLHETSILEDKVTFTFSGTFNKGSMEKDIWGTFSGTRVDYKRVETNKRDNTTATSDRHYGWSATFSKGEIKGKLDDWPGPFELTLVD